MHCGHSFILRELSILYADGAWGLFYVKCSAVDENYFVLNSNSINFLMLFIFFMLTKKVNSWSNFSEFISIYLKQYPR